MTYVRYAETARTAWVRNIANRVDPAHRSDWMALVNSSGIGLILKSIKTDFKFVSQLSCPRKKMKMKIRKEKCQKIKYAPKKAAEKKKKNKAKIRQNQRTFRVFDSSFYFLLHTFFFFFFSLQHAFSYEKWKMNMKLLT